MSDSLNASTRQLLHRVAKQVIRISKVPIQNAPSFDVVWGTVDSIDVSDRTLGIKLQGSASAQLGIKFLGSYQPTVGDYVANLKHGRDLFCIGTLSGQGMGLQIPFSYSIVGAIVASSDASNTPPPFPWPVPDGQIVRITAFRAKILAGTSVNIDCQLNGTGITGLTSLDISTTASSHVLGTPLALANFDELGIVVNSVSGDPKGFMGAFYAAVSG